MAEVLDIQHMLADTFEPLRKFRWIISINGIDAFLAHSATRPHLTFGQTVIDYINQRRTIAGKGTWDTISLSLYDPIVPSASQKVMEWIRLVWENTTGRMGYAQMYKKDISLKLLDPVGQVAQQWTLQGAWIQDSNWGDLDYSSDDLVTIDLVLQFDQAVLEF